MARDRVLVRLDAAVRRLAKGAQLSAVVLPGGRVLLLPAERQVRRRNNLDKVHKIVVRVVRLLVSVVERVQVVLSPRQDLLAHLFGQILGQLGPEAQVVDVVGEGMPLLNRRVPVVLEVVHVHVAVAEAATGRDVEVADDLVDAQATLDAAAFMSLFIQPLGVVLALALLDALASAESPRRLRIRLSDLVASRAATGLLGVVWGRSAAARAAVVWI